MRRTCSVVLVTSLACLGILLAMPAGASAPAKAAKASCNAKTAVKDIEPIMDKNASAQSTFKQVTSTIQFGQQKAVQKQIKAVLASNPLKTVRANPVSDITFPDKRSAIGNLVITLDPARTQTINQGPQFFMCVGKDQNGKGKGSWVLTLYSYCNLAALAPCPPAMVNQALGALTPKLLAETTK
jgi:hypothetical protein